MVTVKRTNEAVLLTLPADTSEAQLRAMLRVYEASRSSVLEGLPGVAEGDYDPAVGKVAVALGRTAKHGSWALIKEQFKDHPDYEKLLRTAGEEK